MGFKVIIPARYASSRLPGKPLLDIGGKPMLQHVYERARLSGAEEVLIATDDQRVGELAARLGAPVQMTGSHHRSGTERLAEVVRERGEPGDRIIVNLQGDEPLIPPALISQVAELLDSRPNADVATLCEPIETLEELLDPGVVKVVRDGRDRALYFSRAPIPWHRESFARQPVELPSGQRYYRHLGIYAYRVSYLLDFVESEPSAIEETESLEQLRALYHGGRIVVAQAVEKSGPGVDTETDLEKVRKMVGA